MHPEILSYPHISSYSFFWLAGFFAGYLVARWAAKRRAILGSHIDNVVLILMLTVPLGARWFSRLFYLPNVSFWESFKVWSGGGLVFYGGVLIGFLSVLVYARVRRIAVLDLLDVLAPAVAVGLALGRIGCFLGGCCWGDVCVDTARVAELSPQIRSQVHSWPWVSDSSAGLAVQFPTRSAAFKQHLKLGLVDSEADRSLPVHPVQIYEAALALLLSAVLLARLCKRRSPGEIILWLAFGYGVIRFGTEFLRADNAPVYWGMTLSQVISVVIMTLAAAARASRWFVARSGTDHLSPLPVMGDALVRGREQR